MQVLRYLSLAFVVVCVLAGVRMAAAQSAQYGPPDFAPRNPGQSSGRAGSSATSYNGLSGWKLNTPQNARGNSAGVPTMADDGSLRVAQGVSLGSNITPIEGGGGYPNNQPMYVMYDEGGQVVTSPDPQFSQSYYGPNMVGSPDMGQMGPQSVTTMQPAAGPQTMTGPMMVPQQGMQPTPMYGQGPFGQQPAGAMQQPGVAMAVLGKFSVFGEFLYLQPRGTDVAYAVPQDGLAVAGAVPVGAVANTDLDFAPGFRFGGSLAMGEDAWLSGTYTWYSVDGTSTATTDAPNVLNPLVLFPGTFNAGFAAEQASASQAIDNWSIDIDYQVAARYNDRFWLGYLIGARYAQLDQTFSANYEFAAPDGTTDLNTEVNFEGTGIRLGVEGERVIFPGRGFRAYSRGIANIMFGEWNASYTQTNQFNGVEATTSIREDRVVPVLELEAGVAWVGRNGRLRLAGGYMVSWWFNAISTQGWIDSVQAQTYAPGGDNISFDGIVGRAEWWF